jgi:hypothetical protein
MATTAAVKKAPPGRPPASPSAVPDPAAPPPQPSSRRRQVPLTPMRRETAQRMRKLAAQVQESHPDLTVHDHLRDAARTLESGNEEASQRHLRAAMFSLSPQSLMKNGMHTDDLHLGAREVLHGVHRHLLLVKDIVDVKERNAAQVRRDSYGDDASSPPMPQPPAHDPNAGYGPGALAQRPTARQPGGDRALNAPARNSSGGSDPAVADPNGPQPRGSKQFTTRNGVRAVTELAYGWDDLAAVIGRDPVELSAETGRLAATPAPRGKPGGPGLYDVKGMGHTNYEQQIVKALIEKRGMDPGRAYAIARGAIRKWARGGGHVHPEVRAAAGAAETGELARQARAKAVHGHSVTWDDVALTARHVIEMAAAPPPAQSSGSVQPRVPAGQAGGGQFGSGSGQPDAHQQHVAHVAHMKNVAAKQGKAAAGKTAKAAAGKGSQQKQALEQKAAGFRAKADALIAQRDALQKALASASGKTSSGQSGSTTSAGSSTTASSAPAASSTTAASTAATPASSTTPAAPASPAAASSAATPSAAQLTSQIAQLNTQIVAYQQAYKQAMAQAAAIK